MLTKHGTLENLTEPGSQSEQRGGARLFYHTGRTLVLPDLVLREDIDPDWATQAKARSNHVWSSSDVPRPRVRIGNYVKETDLINRIDAMADLVSMLYNTGWGREIKLAAIGFKRLAEERINNFRSYPLEVLAVTFEKLMHHFIYRVRGQCRKLIMGIERSRKSTRRPHIFGHLRMAMMGRDEHRSRLFEWPVSFRDVLSERSVLREELQKMISARMAQQLAHGAASFTIPVATTSNAKRSQRDVTHAVGASNVAATGDENDVFEDGDVDFDALSGEKDRGGGVAKPSSDVAPILRWGNAYQPADVNVRPGDSLTRAQWVEAHTFWLSLFLSAAKPGKRFSLHCLSGATNGGCGDHVECATKWAKLQPLADVKHGPLPLPVYKLYAHDVRPAAILASVAVARGGGFTNHDAKILPTDVRAEMAKRKSAYQQQVDAKDGGSGGTAGGRARRAAFTTAAAGGEVCDEASMLSEGGLEDALDPPPLGGGAVALFSRGRGGRRVPASLAELAFDDAEQLLDSAVNDPDARPAPPPSSGVPVPKCGLGDYFSFEFPSDEDVAREAVAEWLSAAPMFESDLRGRGASVRSYARSLGGTLLLREVPDPLSSGLTADASWLLVRSRALQRASTSTEVAISEWAVALRRVTEPADDVAAGAVLGSAPPGARISVAPGLEPGGHAITRILGEPWRVDDHGEMLAADGDPDGPERAKCLYLAVAAAVGIEPAKLLAAMKKRARTFLKYTPKPKPGVLVPEAILYAFELAHDLVHRDHPQMRASFLWFGAEVLAHSQICFLVAVGNGDFRVEFMTGHKYSDLSPDRGRLGFVECAASHARRLTPPWASVGRDGVSAWEQRVKEGTGVKPGRWIMSGADEIMVALKQHSGQQRMRDPATLWKCEICPSATAPSLRVRPRRYIGEEHVCAAESDPLMVMVAASGLSQVVAESCVVLSRISSLRESAEVSAAQAVLAGAPPVKRVGFAGDSERIGHSDTPLEISLDFSLLGVGEFGSGALQYEPCDG